MTTESTKMLSVSEFYASKNLFAPNRFAFVTELANGKKNPDAFAWHKEEVLNIISLLEPLTVKYDVKLNELGDTMIVTIDGKPETKDWLTICYFMNSIACEDEPKFEETETGLKFTFEFD